VVTDEPHRVVAETGARTSWSKEESSLSTKKIGVAATAIAEMNSAVPFMAIVRRSSEWLLP
jgi:hypothetical protein